MASKLVTFRADQGFLAVLAKAAAAEGVSKSEAIRRAVCERAGAQ